MSIFTLTQMSTSLESVAASDDDLIKSLFTFNSTPELNSEDRVSNRLNASIIYYDMGLLDPQDATLIQVPNFTQTYLDTKGNIAELRRRLSTNIITDNPTIIDDVMNDVDDVIDDGITANKQLVLIFKELAAYYKTTGGDFEGNAFYVVGNIIKDLPQKVTSLNDVTNIPRLGKSSLAIIDDYLKTGKSSRLQTIKGQHPDITKILELFIGIFGVNPMKAYKLYQSGCRTLADVGAHKLTPAQSLGLEYYYHLKEPISREEINTIVNTIRGVNGGNNALNSRRINFSIVGSFRRGEPTSQHIDIIVGDFEEPYITIQLAADTIKVCGLLIGVLSQDVHKLSAIVKLPGDHVGRRIDIRLFSKEEYPYALMYNTGSQRFNDLMRQHAATLGLTLNEYGLTRISDGHKIPAVDERDIFDNVYVAPIPPAGRTQTLTQLTLGAPPQSIYGTNFERYHDVPKI
jgi:DNA polymerase/3'-5' exonuclease PolX